MVNKQKRKIVKLTDIVIIIVLLLICVITMWFIKSNDKAQLIAQISYNSKVVKEIDLDTAANTTFNLQENKAVSFQILDHKIRFINTDCPDKLCENFGYLKNVNDTAICLPNKVSLKLIGSKKDIDILIN